MTASSFNIAFAVPGYLTVFIWDRCKDGAVSESCASVAYIVRHTGTAAGIPSIWLCLSLVILGFSVNVPVSPKVPSVGGPPSVSPLSWILVNLAEMTYWTFSLNR